MKRSIALMTAPSSLRSFSPRYSQRAPSRWRAKRRLSANATRSRFRSPIRATRSGLGGILRLPSVPLAGRRVGGVAALHLLMLVQADQGLALLPGGEAVLGAGRRAVLVQVRQDILDGAHRRS